MERNFTIFEDNNANPPLTNRTEEWEWQIGPKQKWFDLGLNELINYKDLIFRFVQKNIAISYKQTILGPFWIFLQPLLTTLVYVIIFSRIVKLSTNGIPPVLFYLTGTIVWTFFSECLTENMNTFLHHSHVFSKVYFPRLIVPISNIISQFVRLSIQLLLFIIIYILYMFLYPGFQPSLLLLLLPYLLLLTAGFGVGLGLIVSVFTAKYRDLANVVHFLLRLFMYATPVVFPLSIVPQEYKLLFLLNPLTTIIETFRAAFFRNDMISAEYIVIATITVTIVLFIGVVLFKKRELTIMDTI